MALGVVALHLRYCMMVIGLTLHFIDCVSWCFAVYLIAIPTY